jgi:hypothetical protein
VQPAALNAVFKPCMPVGEPEVEKGSAPTAFGRGLVDPNLLVKTKVIGARSPFRERESG